MLPLAGMSILIVEDDFFVAEDLAYTLAEEGAAVIGPVGSVAEALDIITRQENLDRAVLDVTLRRENVYPVADLLRRRGVPFVFLTGYDKGSLLKEFADEQIVNKPLDLAQLIAKLTALATSGVGSGHIPRHPR